MNGEARFTPGTWFVCRHGGKATICVADGLGHREIPIAAAPDLYVALEKLVDHLESIGTIITRKEEPFVKAARAALAKARGEL